MVLFSKNWDVWEKDPVGSYEDCSDLYYSNDSNESIFTNHWKLILLDILLLDYCL